MPFSVEQFFAVFAAYNAAIWPAQIAAYGVGVAILAALLIGGLAGQRIILLGLAAMWAFNGAVYQLGFFAPLNPAARGFGAAFLLQALLFAGFAFGKRDLGFRIRFDLRGVLAAAMIAYALAIYEVLGSLAGHGLMAGPLFGVAPCPTTIFTIGLLVLSNNRAATWLAIIPLLWALVGTSAAILLSVREDFGLGISAVILLALILARSRQRAPRPTIPG
jgi:hypothetical protein